MAESEAGASSYEDDDERLAALYAALSAAAPEELVAPLVEASGGRLVAASREDVAYRPGRDATVRLAATVLREGQEVLEGWVLSAGGPPPEGTLVLDGPAGRVAAWRVRDDPQLRGLRSALDVPTVARLLTALGLPGDGVRLSLISVRPRRRAVVEVQTPTARLFLKCVPAGAVPDLEVRHAACREAGLPVPVVLGADRSLGIVVLSPLPGSSLRGVLTAAGTSLPPPEQVTELLQGFAALDLDLPARDPRRHARGHAALLQSVLPAERQRVDDQLGQVVTGSGDRTGGAHGDFYDGQLMVQEGRVVGVVDVDGVGAGRPADDAGNLLAHLLVLRQVVPPPAAVHRWLPEVATQVAGLHDPHELARSTAAVLLGLATWPHTRHQADWVRQTRQLLDLVDVVLREGVPAAGSS